MQIPPMYSAIKIGGKKLYEMARKGIEVERKPRKITVYNIDIIKFMPPDKILIDVECSKGTYIRSLCGDIGEKLGCGAHMSSLLRTMSGQFNIKDSITLDQLKQKVENGEVESVLLKTDEVLNQYKKVYVSPKAEKILYNGGKIYEYFLKDKSDAFKIGDSLRVYDNMENFVGIYIAAFDEEKNKRVLKPQKMFI